DVALCILILGQVTISYQNSFNMKGKILHGCFFSRFFLNNLLLLLFAFLIFSCQNDNGWNLKDESSITPPYLEFSDAQEFADYIIDPANFDILEDFVPLSKIIN